jgi:hypothetical protein
MSVETVLLTALDKDEEDVKTTVYVPKNVLRSFKHFAADDDTTLTLLIVKAMREYAIKRLTKK